MRLNKLIILLALLLMLSPLTGGQSWFYKANFLTTAVDVGTSTTATNGTEFTSAAIWVSRLNADPTFCLVTITFTRTTGSAEEVDFKLIASFDDGTTYTTDAYETITVATNIVATSSVVVHSEIVWIAGVSHLKLGWIDNRDTTIALTDCNASVSLGRK